jgi:hypothetical protein
MEIATRFRRLAFFWSMGTQVCLAGQVQVKIAPDRQITLGFDSEAKILFYPQVHDMPGLTGEGRTEVVRSQYCLATFLKENPHYEVFLEGERDTGRVPLSEKQAKGIEGGFPGLALPGCMAEMNAWQQSILIKWGAPPLLFYLGKLPRTHAATPERQDREALREVYERGQKVGKRIDFNDPRSVELLMDVRERGAVENVNKFLAANPTLKVLLVYGMGHDFRKYFSAEVYAEFTGMEAFKSWGMSRPAKEEEKAETKEERKDPRAPGIPFATGIDKLQGNQRTRLMNAVTDQDLVMVQMLLGAKADVRVKDNRGYNALLLAALEGNEPIVEELLIRLEPRDVMAPVTLFKGEILCTYVDSLMVLEEADELEERDPFRKSRKKVIELLRKFIKGLTPMNLFPETPPGMLGNLADGLPPDL